MSDRWEKLKKQDLDKLDGAYEIFECVGLEAFRQLVRTFGGAFIYIPMEKNVLMSARDREIRSRHKDGATCSQLARIYGMSVSRIRCIVLCDNGKAQ